MNLFLLFLLISLGFFVVVLFFFYLHKDQELIMLEARYNEISNLESREHELNKLRDEFLAMMVHDLRSPLTVIRGSSDLLLKEGKTLPQQHSETLLNQIRMSSTEMLKVVNDLLDVSKIESGRFEILKRSGDLNKLLKEEAEYYLSLAKEKNIDLSYDLDKNLGNVVYDDERIRHVLNNLLSNSLKFTEKGGHIVLSSKVIENKFVHIIVSDDGRGVPENMKSRLFNKFVQVLHQDDGEGRGSGLGLYISKGIIEAHGGQIWIEDNFPKGSKFIFSLPL